MEFRLTYSGPLLGDRTDDRAPKRARHKHDIRKHFHRQLKALWGHHPVLIKIRQQAAPSEYQAAVIEEFNREGFRWVPLATNRLSLSCRLEVLMLRQGAPGRVTTDIDNRLKTLFDALRIPAGPLELGRDEQGNPRLPDADEDPFYVLLENDDIITHVAVTTDTLLEPVPDVPEDNAVRLVIDVTLRPYDVNMDNLDFA